MTQLYKVTSSASALIEDNYISGITGKPGTNLQFPMQCVSQ